MILRWLICFNLALVTATSASISGKVELRDSRLDSVIKRQDFSDVVISLSPNGKGAINGAAHHTKMLQKSKTFVPHVLPIVTGTAVDFPNFDPIFHNAFSSYSGQIFDVGLYAPGTNRAVRFTRPGIVRVFCNIHPTMSAVIVVLDTPYFTKTGRDGSFSIDAPAGEYELRIFHERATEQTLSALSRHISVGNEPVQLSDIVVSEAGYLPAPHKNKYGKDYPPVQDDQVVYPGVRN